MFETQLANGIMGMSLKSETPIPTLVANGNLDRKEFALCFALDGGTMTIGGAAAHKHTSEMEYIELHMLGHFYGLTWTDLQLGSESVLEPGSSSYGSSGSSILDSGTTFTYIPKAFKSNFKAMWLSSTGYEYDPETPLFLSAEEVDELPTIRFGFQRKNGNKGVDDVYVNVKPSAYMDFWNGGYYPGIEFEASTLLFGANILMEHDVLFSWEDMQVGFATVTTCEWDETLGVEDDFSPTRYPSSMPTQFPTIPEVTLSPTFADTTDLTPQPTFKMTQLPSGNLQDSTTNPTSFATSITIPTLNTPSSSPTRSLSPNPTRDGRLPSSNNLSFYPTSNSTEQSNFTFENSNHDSDDAVLDANTQIIVAFCLLLCPLLLAVSGGYFVWMKRPKWGRLSMSDSISFQTDGTESDVTAQIKSPLPRDIDTAHLFANNPELELPHKKNRFIDHDAHGKHFIDDDDDDGDDIDECPEIAIL